MRTINAYDYDVTGEDEIIDNIETDIEDNVIYVWENFIQENGRLDYLWGNNNKCYPVLVNRKEKKVLLGKAYDNKTFIIKVTFYIKTDNLINDKIKNDLYFWIANIYPNVYKRNFKKLNSNNELILSFYIKKVTVCENFAIDCIKEIMENYFDDISQKKFHFNGIKYTLINEKYEIC